METNFTPKRIELGLKKYFDAKKRKVIIDMQRVGETFINESRVNGDYIDQTGNLRSSVGYAIGLNGNEPTVNKTGTQVLKGEKGVEQAKVYGQQLIRDEDEDSLVLAGFAGMEYAIDVESRGRDVITGSTKRAMRRMKFLIRQK